MRIDVFVSGPHDDRRGPPPTPIKIGAAWNFNNGSSAEDVCLILGRRLMTALDRSIGKGHGISISYTKTSIHADGARVVGGSSGSADDSKAYWEFEGEKAGKTLPYDPKWNMRIERHGFAPFDGFHYIGVLHVRAMGVRTGKDGPCVASSSTNFLVCQGMTGPLIAKALQQALVREDWDADLNPEDDCSVQFSNIPGGVKITSVVYRFEGFEGKPDVERGAYDFAILWGPPIPPRKRGNGGGSKGPR